MVFVVPKTKCSDLTKRGRAADEVLSLKIKESCSKVVFRMYQLGYNTFDWRKRGSEMSLGFC